MRYNVYLSAGIYPTLGIYLGIEAKGPYWALLSQLPPGHLIEHFRKGFMSLANAENYRDEIWQAIVTKPGRNGGRLAYRARVFPSAA